MTWRGLDRSLAFAVRVAETVTHSSQSFDNSGASAEYLLKDGFRMLTGRYIQVLCGHFVEAGKITVGLVWLALFIEDMFANGL